MLSQSEADEAYIRFKKLIHERNLLRYEDPQLSEADTRAKLIDPLFRDVLAWSEAEIRRETPAAQGFADYILGSDTSYLLIEAKRTKPRFRLDAPSRPRKLKLDGPHLLGQKKVRPFLQQVQSYASDLGAQCAILTNGSQLIVFRPYLVGRPWSDGIAIVFHDHDDMVQDFALLHSLLSRDRVCAGALLEEFEQFEGLTTPLYAPIQFLPDADLELVRNPFWAKISHVLGPLLTDLSENPQAQAEVIRHCYITTPLTDEVDASLDRRLRDSLPKYLQEAKTLDIRPGSGRRSAFGHQLEQDITGARPGTYILTGGVGSGKTTFLRRFAATVDPAFIEHYCAWMHVDFLPVGNADPSILDQRIYDYVYQICRSELRRLYPSHIPSTGDEIRSLFSEELDRLQRTKLYDIPVETLEWKTEVNTFVDQLYNGDVAFVTAVLRKLLRSSARPVFVLDNTDQMGEAFQERVFLLAQRLSREHQALCIVALREEKFFAAYRRGLFDAFGDRRFHIGSPDLRQVLRRRLEFGRERLHQLAETDRTASEELEQIDQLLQALIKSATDRNANIVRMLACVSNGDTRHALDMFRDFVSSGNTNIQKIIDIVRREGGYTVPFHEFAKSAILGSRKYYRSSVSHIVNIFKQSAARRASHLTALRLLARLSRAEEVASPHGEGFLKTKNLLREYRESFGSAEDFQDWAGELLLRGLIESEPPRAKTVLETEALRITASGAYYWRYFARAFAYLDLMIVDTPIADKHLAHRLAELAETTEMAKRFDRVRLFLSSIERSEEQELEETARRGGPYKDALVPEIKMQLERELAFIARKVGMRVRADTSAPRA